MSVKTTTVHTCDGCGATEENVRQVWANWNQLTLTNIPSSGMAGATTTLDTRRLSYKTWHLCGPCSRAVKDAPTLDDPLTGLEVLARIVTGWDPEEGR